MMTKNPPFIDSKDDEKAGVELSATETLQEDDTTAYSSDQLHRRLVMPFVPRHKGDLSVSHKVNDRRYGMRITFQLDCQGATRSVVLWFALALFQTAPNSQKMSQLTRFFQSPLRLQQSS